MTVRVAIVGGGFSGLLAAHLLERHLDQAVDTTVLEASSRLGGRVQTRSFREFDISYDAGAAEFYDITGSPALKRLVADLGLPTTPLRATPYFHLNGQILREKDDYERVLGAAGVAALDRFWSNGLQLRPPRAYSRAGHPADNDHPWVGERFSDVLARIPHAGARELTRVQVHSDVATEPELTNGLFGFDNLLIDHPEYCRMYTVNGGNEEVVRALRDRVRGDIVLGAPVVGVESPRNGGVRIDCLDDNRGTRTYHADFAIVTLGPLQLADVWWGGHQLRECMSFHIGHHLFPTDYLRVTWVFPERHWADEFPEDYFVTSAFGGTTIYDKSCDGRGVLSGLVAGAAATRLSRLPDVKIGRAVLRALPAVLSRMSVIAQQVDRYRGRNGVSRQPGGRVLLGLDERHGIDRPNGRVFLCGDYLYDATLCGAHEAVVRVVERIATLTGGPALDLRPRSGMPEAKDIRETIPFVRAN